MVYLKDPVWFSPLNVIHHAGKIIKVWPIKEIGNKKFRKIIEAYSVAQMLVGQIKLEKKEYWMQIVDDTEESPDIRTLRYADQQSEKFDYLEQIDVEVVEYEQHTKISIPEFVLEKKFSKNKSYDENTVILCHVGFGVKSVLPSKEEIEGIMAKIKSPCQIMLLIGIDEQVSKLQLIELRPRVGILTEFNLEEELKNKKYNGVVTLKSGSRRPSEKRPNNKHYPFERLGYIPDLNGQYKIV